MPSANSSPPASTADAASASPGDSPPVAPGFGIYLHWPFCRAKCPYCDFNVHIRDRVEDADWSTLLAAELAHFRTRVGPIAVTSIYFGGGTPSLMAPAAVSALIDKIAGAWPQAADVEISLEANPNDWQNFEGYRSAGVTRLSLGVQSFDDHALCFLGRDHSAATAEEALERALALFPEVSCDLIYMLPGQTVSDWRAALQTSLAKVGYQLSLYQLTIEAGTAFHREAEAGRIVLPDGDRAADLYALSQELCDAAGLPAYEVSNHAALSYRCRHNLTYWQGGDYVGVGPGAHGRRSEGGNRIATRQYRNPATWSDAVRQYGHGTETSETLDRTREIEETFLFGLRTVDGISRKRFRALFDQEPEKGCESESLAVLKRDGLVECDAEGLRATAAGRPLLDAILGRLLVAH